MIKQVKTTNLCDSIDIDGKKLKSFSYSIDGTTDPEILEMQAAVFNHFDMPLNQVIHDNPTDPWNKHMGHSIFLNATMWLEDADYYLFWDLDCIPLEEGFIECS